MKYLCDWVRSGWVLGTTLQSAIYWGKKWKNSFCLPLTVLKHFSFQNQFNFQFRTSLNTCVLLDQGCRSRGQGPMAPPDFDRSVNTNATMGHIMPPPHITDCPPPSNFQTFLRPCAWLYGVKLEGWHFSVRACKLLFLSASNSELLLESRWRDLYCSGFSVRFRQSSVR